jgi:hypothetical protein
MEFSSVLDLRGGLARGEREFVRFLGYPKYEYIGSYVVVFAGLWFGEFSSYHAMTAKRFRNRRPR